MITEKIKDEIQSAVQTVFNIHLKSDEIKIEKPQKKEYGDFATNIAFKLAGKLGVNPLEIADKLAKQLESTGSFKRVESEGAFINFVLKRDFIAETVKEILKKEKKYGQNNLFKGKKVQIEFISANPTGPLTIAIGRGGFGGDALSNVFQFCGAEVEREYYVNDGGNQVRILGNSLLIAAGKMKPEGDFYRGEYIDLWVKKNIETIEKLKDDTFELGYICSKDILKNYIKPETNLMKIKFDNWYSERSLNEKNLPEKAVKFLEKNKLTYKKDGAVWLKTSEFGDDKDRVIVKSDGSFTYVTPDIAYHWEKFRDRKFDLVIDILGADHHGYTDRMLAGIAALGHGSNIRYLLTQMIRLVKDGKEFKMSKRKGVVVTISELFDLIGGETASDVARFFFLSRSFNTHMDFDLDLAQKQSEKNPVFYVKYAHARLCGIIEKAKELKLPKADLNLLKTDEEFELAEQLANLPVLLQSIVTMHDYPVHLLTFYVRDLATAFHRFYDKCRVIDEKNLELTSARLELIKATQVVLKTTMEDLIGISAPNKM